MSKFMGVAASSLVAGLLVAVAGCSSSSTTHGASASPTEQVSTASTSSATGTGVSALSPTASAPEQANTPSPVPSSDSSAVAQNTDTPFPGMWPITTWQQYAATEQAVEQGHQPWLRDPALVVDAWAHRWTPAPPVVRVTSDEFQVTQPGTTTVYTIRGTRPVSTGPAPIWVITSITHS